MSGAREGIGEAHGKVILLGEHSVVYGRPALAAGLPRGAIARARWSEVDRLAIEPWGVSIEANGAPEALPLSRAFDTLLDQSGARSERPVLVEARVFLPSGAGLGSSAALGVAVLRALDDLRGIARQRESEQAVSLAWEQVFHGNPSGVDNAMAIAGGLAQYVRGEPLARVLARRPFMLVIGDSGEAASTKETVASVARQHEKSRERLEKTFDAIASIVRNARLAIETGDLRALGQLLDMNQRLLASMLLSTTTLEEMIAEARSAGALGAKLTGGGGGGCMIALAEGRAEGEAIKDAIEKLGKRAFLATVGETR